MGQSDDKISAAKVSDWMIERLAQGELDAATAQEVRSRLAAELGSKDAVEARLALLAQADRETLGQLPARLMVPKILARVDEVARAAQPAPPRARPLVWLSPIAVAAMALVVYVGTKGASNSGPAGGLSGTATSAVDEERTKGDGMPRLLAFRSGALGDVGVEQLAAGASVRPRDLLQLAYAAGEARFGVVVSVDGGGGVTQHLPLAPAAVAPALSAAGVVRLPSSYELDETPGFERFFFVTSAKPFPAGAVMAAAQALAKAPATATTQKLALPAELSQESLLLKKVTP